MTEISSAALALLKRKCSSGGPPIIHTPEVQELERELIAAGLFAAPGIVTPEGYDAFREMIREPVRIAWN